MKTVYLTLLLSTGIFLSSCSEDFLDLKPKTQLSVDDYYKTAEQFESAVNGAYSSLQKTNLYGNWYVLSEIPSDNTSNQLSGSVTDQDEFDKYYIRSTNPFTANFWNSSYMAINRINTVLDRIDGIEIDKSVSDRYKLECKFLRGLLYFNLVRVFGDVPLVLNEISISDSYAVLRESKDKVYSQIISDLSAAEALPGSYAEDVNKGRATSGAAKALLGKVYLTMKNYKDAETKLAEVIASNKYSLLENTAGSLNVNGYAAVFNASNHNNSESVFDVQFKKGGFGEGSNFPNSFAPENSGTNVVPLGTTGGNNLPGADIINAYETGDLRKDFSVASGYYDSRKNGAWVESKYIKKYFDTPYKDGDANNNFPVIRYADVLLMYSEALNQNGKTAEACNYLNKVRRRGFGYQTTEASPVDINTTSKDVFFLKVEQERRVELAFEGQRWFDLIRTDRAVEVMTSKGYKLNATNLICPIPQKQIDVNPILTQNDYQIVPK